MVIGVVVPVVVELQGGSGGSGGGTTLRYTPTRFQLPARRVRITAQY